MHDEPAATRDGPLAAEGSEDWPATSGEDGSQPRPVGWRESLGVWARIGLLSFGGPAGQIAVMQRILVDEKRWLSQDRFLHALNYCMLLPGPEATQLMTYVGWLMHRVWGGVLAGVLFVLPGFVSILALSLVYTSFGETGAVQAVFFGLKPAVLAIVLGALVRIGKRTLHGWAPSAIAIGTFAAMFVLRAPFPAVIGGAALAGWLLGRTWPSAFAGVQGGHSANAAGSQDGLIDQLSHADMLAHTKPNARKALMTLVIWGGLWWLPVAILAIVQADQLWLSLGLFFSKAAVVTFGGAYAVLAYLAQQAVEQYHWVTATEMLDGLGMAETTPGPLIQVVQHVGFMGAFRQAEGLPPAVAGVLAAVLVTWVTFVPCFLWIFLGAPFMEHLRSHRGIRSALAGITAAVVGVVANLAVWFAAHTMFGDVGEVRAGPVRVIAPEASSADWRAIVIAALACVLVFAARWGVVRVLGVCVAAGMCLLALT
ncbi:MAG: chromate efflux transporter [Phycisphaeraceae bacterium]|nr:chromate efflux transporter [Phycisphaeraceae bacterium]